MSVDELTLMLKGTSGSWVKLGKVNGHIGLSNVDIVPYSVCEYNDFF